MADAGFFRVRCRDCNQEYWSDSLHLQGTSSDQDNRFSDKEKKLLKTMKFEDNLVKKVDMSKVKIDVLKPWITKRIYEMLKMEDDVVVEFIFNQLEEKVSFNPFFSEFNVKHSNILLWENMCEGNAWV